MKAIIAAWSACLLLAACTPPALDNLGNIGKDSDPTRFYTLTTHGEAEQNTPTMPELVLGVGPVSVADYLDRSHIVVRKADNELELADFDRWAGSPAKEIQRVLAANLAAQLGTERVVGYPWKSSIEPDMTVEMTVERFEYDATDGHVWLVASWQVFADGGREVLTYRRHALSHESGRGYGEISAALSVLAQELSAQVADAVRKGYRAPRRR